MQGSLETNLCSLRECWCNYGTCWACTFDLFSISWIKAWSHSFQESHRRSRSTATSWPNSSKSVSCWKTRWKTLRYWRLLRLPRKNTHFSKGLAPSTKTLSPSKSRTPAASDRTTSTKSSAIYSTTSRPNFSQKKATKSTEPRLSSSSYETSSSASSSE